MNEHPSTTPDTDRAETGTGKGLSFAQLAERARQRGEDLTIVHDPGPLEDAPAITPGEHPDLAAVLMHLGVQLGEHDRRVAARLQGLDTSTTAPIATWLQRTYAAGMQHSLAYAAGHDDAQLQRFHLASRRGADDADQVEVEERPTRPELLEIVKQVAMAMTTLTPLESVQGVLNLHGINLPQQPARPVGHVDNDEDPFRTL